MGRQTGAPIHPWSLCFGGRLGFYQLRGFWSHQWVKVTGVRYFLFILLYVVYSLTRKFRKKQNYQHTVTTDVRLQSLLWCWKLHDLWAPQTDGIRQKLLADAWRKEMALIKHSVPWHRDMHLCAFVRFCIKFIYKWWILHRGKFFHQWAVVKY